METGPSRPLGGSYAAFHPGGQYASYLSSYAASVGVNAATYEITGCSGPLAEAPGMCAALNQHVAQLPESQWQDPTKYYGRARYPPSTPARSADPRVGGPPAGPGPSRGSGSRATGPVPRRGSGPRRDSGASAPWSWAWAW